MRHLFYLTLLSLLAFSQPAKAFPFEDGSRILGVCNKAEYSKACLAGLLTYRCTVYNFDYYRVGQCLDAAKAMAEILDMEAPAINGSIAFVAFSKDVHDLLNEPFTQRYLQAMQAKLERGRLDDPFELWEFTLRAAKGNTATALRLIAVLLQDTSTDKFHLSYIGQKFEGKLPDETLGLLSNVLDLLEPGELAKHQATTKWLKLYPSLPGESELHFRTNLYHFYTISYLAMRLNWKTRNARLSAFLPLLLESSYKFRKIAPKRWPVMDPKTIDATQYKDELSDMYTAYIGSRWAVGASAHGWSYEDFTKKMAADPSAFLTELYKGE